MFPFGDSEPQVAQGVAGWGAGQGPGAGMQVPPAKEGAGTALHHPSSALLQPGGNQQLLRAGTSQVARGTWEVPGRGHCPLSQAQGQAAITCVSAGISVSLVPLLRACKD